jgi:hypothetical protein
MEAVMTPMHVDHPHHHWTELFDYEMVWMLTFSSVVIACGIFGLSSIAQNTPLALGLVGGH